jgi:hypothetical protein
MNFGWKDVVGSDARWRDRVHRRPRTLLGWCLWPLRRAWVLARPWVFWSRIGVGPRASVCWAAAGTLAFVLFVLVAYALIRALLVIAMRSWKLGPPLLDQMVMSAPEPYALAMIGYRPSGRLLIVFVQGCVYKCGLVGAVAGFAVAWLFSLLVILRWSRREAGVSKKQVVIAAIRSLAGVGVAFVPWMLWPWLVVIQQVYWLLGGRGSTLGRLYREVAQHQLLLTAVFAFVWAMVWWHCAVTRGWRMRHGRAVSIGINTLSLFAACVIGALAAYAATFGADRIRLW